MGEQTFRLEFHVEPDAEIPIERLLTMFHPNNSQTRTPQEMEAIKQAILTDGFLAEMIIVNLWNDKLVSGHGRVQACWDLGYRGALPVILKTYPSDLEHRLAMLRWNKARGHQDAEQEQRELSALMQTYSREELGRHTARDDGDWGWADTGADGSAAGESGRVDDPPSMPGERAAWPWLNVAVTPETMALYVSFLGDLPGHDEAWKFDMILSAVDEAALR